MRYSQPLVLVLALCSLVGCSEDEPTVEEFVAEFDVVALEFYRIAVELNNQPMPELTGDRKTDLQNFSTMLRADAVKFDPVIERIENLVAPSDPPEAEQLRQLFLDTVVLIRDDLLQSATDIDNGQRPTFATSFEQTIVINMMKIADLADLIGMDSSGFRRYAEETEAAILE